MFCLIKILCLGFCTTSTPSCGHHFSIAEALVAFVEKSVVQELLLVDAYSRDLCKLGQSNHGVTEMLKHIYLKVDLVFLTII